MSEAEHFTNKSEIPALYSLYSRVPCHPSEVKYYGSGKVSSQVNIRISPEPLKEDYTHKSVEIIGGLVFCVFKNSEN